MREPFQLGGEIIPAGERRTIDIPLGLLSDHTLMNLIAHVFHARKDGPTMFVSGAVHGDEIIGVEIIRRLFGVKALSRMRGTLILVPVVNAYGFIGHSRYLPDRRDLNRSFPGSEKGSLASQLAFVFMQQIVAQSQYGIDLHSGAVHRANLPQIRAELDNPEVAGLAKAFGASIMLNANLRDGSLRQASQDMDCNTLLYEAGEALRFDETAIRIGVRGVMGVMRHIGMLSKSRKKKSLAEPIQADSSHWLRAPMGGVMRAQKSLGDRVKRGEVVAMVSDPLGQHEEALEARTSGIVIGRSNLPIVNRGDALYHIARVESLSEAEDAVEAIETDVENDPLFDNDQIV